MFFTIVVFLIKYLFLVYSLRYKIVCWFNTFSFKLILLFLFFAECVCIASRLLWGFSCIFNLSSGLFSVGTGTIFFKVYKDLDFW